MENKHTPTPYEKNGLNIEVFGRGIVARCLTPNEGGVFECVANAEFIVTACNNYQALKEENEELKEQIKTLNDIIDKAIEKNL